MGDMAGEGPSEEVSRPSSGFLRPGPRSLQSLRPEQKRNRSKQIQVPASEDSRVRAGAMVSVTVASPCREAEIPTKGALCEPWEASICVTQRQTP
jgi:hypothetical protein